MNGTRIGVVGTRWGLAHAAAFAAAGVRVHALCGRDGERTRRAAAQLGIERAFDDLDAMCAHVAAVVLAGPEAAHADHVVRAVAAGAHVLCEKPLPAESTALERLARAAQRSRERGRLCAINFPMPRIPSIRTLLARFDGRAVRVEIEVVHLPAVDFAQPSADFNGLSHYLDLGLRVLGARARRVRAALRETDLSLAIECTAARSLRLTAAMTHDPMPIRFTLRARDDDQNAELSGCFDPERGGLVLGPVIAAGRQIAAATGPAAGAELPWGRLYAGDPAWARALLAGFDPPLEPWSAALVDTAAAYARTIEGHRLEQPLSSLERGIEAAAIVAAALESARNATIADVRQF
jgi:myo-inositol 2-dehydrogenase / D-chiro-inositol 1-dehydrogenase